MSRGTYEDEDIQRVELDGEGNEIIPKQSKARKLTKQERLSKSYTPIDNQARLPKTDRQAEALKSVKLTAFTSKSQHDAFKAVEVLAAGADDQSFLIGAWMDNCISYWAKVNAYNVTRPLDNLIKYMGNENSRTNWVTKFGNKVLEKRNSVKSADLEEMLLKKKAPEDTQKKEEEDDFDC